jgi:chromosome segregation ATPase
MRLVGKLKTFIQTAVSDLFGEETETAVVDPLSPLIRQTQIRLNELSDELAQAIAREKRAETMWRTSQAQGKPETEEMEQRHRAFVRATASLQLEMDQLQARLDGIRQRSGRLNEQEESVVTIERLQQLRKEMNKAADSLHTELEERGEQIAQREDKTAAREDIEDVKRRLKS